MLFCDVNSFRICDLCKEQAYIGFLFDWIETMPIICERCVVRKLGLNLNWNPEIIEITKKRDENTKRRSELPWYKKIFS